MAALSGTRRSRRKSVVKPRESSHSTRVHGKKIQRIRSIPQEDVAETKELVKEKGVIPQEKEPDYRRYREEAVKEKDKDKSKEQMLPELDEFLGGEKGRKKRRERIKKNVKKGWKELGLLEKRGLA